MADPTVPLPGRPPGCGVGTQGRGMPLEYRAARAEDIAECFVLRGKTRENAIDRQRLEAAGVTVDSWAEETRSGALVGHVCTSEGTIVGYCFGSPVTGEVVVLALLPPFEGRGIGRALLERVVHDLRRAGHARLFLGSSPDPATRSHGFYRHLGWRSTGRSDAAGDEVLEYVFEGCSRSRTR